MKRIGPYGVMAATAICAISVSGCASSVETEVLGVSEDELFRPNAVSLWPGGRIRVCWKAASFDDKSIADFRSLVPNWVNNDIARHANLIFSDWNKCGAAPDSSWLMLDWDSSNEQSNCPLGYDPSRYRTLKIRGDLPFSPVEEQRSVMVHEFMHALGFQHSFNYETNRESQQCDWQEDEEHEGDTYGTPGYDRTSVTNATYCSPGGTLWWSNLSPWDVVGLQRAYGKKPLGSIVGVNNKCIDIEHPGWQTGAPSGASRLQVWDCTATPNQRWSWNDGANTQADGDVLRTLYAYGVMDIQGGNATNGTPLWNWTLNDTNAQRWRFENVDLVGMGNLCVGVNGAVMAESSLALQNCQGRASHRWTIRKVDAANVEIVQASSAPPLCLTTTTLAGWQRVKLANCDGRLAQKWRLDGRRVKPSSSVCTGSTGCSGVTPYCLDVNRALVQVGQSIGTYPCWPSETDYRTTAQGWTIRGEIRGKNGLCVDVDQATQVRNGSKVQVWGCWGGENQNWEYHF